MATKKIVSITGKEVPMQEPSQSSNEKIAETSFVPRFSYWNGLHVFSILGGCALAMSALTLIPRHNSILYQKYWYEMIFPIGFARFIWAAVKVLELGVLVGKDKLVSIGLHLKIFFTSFLIHVTLFCFVYLFTTRIQGHNHPQPHVYTICFMPTQIIGIFSTPFLLPRKHFEEEDFKQKMKMFILYELCWFMASFTKIFLATMFTKLEHTDAQCIIALLILISKRGTAFVISKVIHRLFGAENERANVLVAVSISVNYGFFAATKIAGARFATVFCMVALEILIQLKMSHQIFKLHKKVHVYGNETINSDKKKALLRLVLAELCEGLIHLAYIIGFVMAYYGPNSKLIGNVGNGDWHYEAVDDVSHTFRVMFGLFAMDLVSLSLNSAIVWMKSNVNIVQEFCYVLKKYWPVLVLKLTYHMYSYFLSNDVNNGYDMTFKFSWLTKNETSI